MPLGSTDEVESTSSDGDRLRPNPDVVVQRMGRDIVLVHLGTDRVFELNHTGAVLWDLLSSGCSPAQIHERMREGFDVESERLAEEIGILLNSLRDNDLVGPYDEG
jgi:hypothetical protein